MWKCLCGGSDVIVGAGLGEGRGWRSSQESKDACTASIRGGARSSVRARVYISEGSSSFEMTGMFGRARASAVGCGGYAGAAGAAEEPRRRAATCLLRSMMLAKSSWAHSSEKKAEDETTRVFDAGSVASVMEGMGCVPQKRKVDLLG